MNDKEKLLRDYIRMCRDNIGDCDNCAIGRECERGKGCEGWIIEHIEKAIKIIEKWAAEHPVKTRQDLFLEQYPNARVNQCGCLDIYPCDLDETMENGFCHRVKNCKECLGKYWLQEVDHE